ncbi:MAG TPA: hypothetical protein PLQ35_07745 [bacterium]|nr:hypothetical protein [bacterium]HQL62172.1 hypothetical protein [bacterium]
MKYWIIFWTVTFFLSLGIFYLTVLLIIPFGIRDLWWLFKLLNDRKTAAETKEPKQSDSSIDRDNGQ